MANSIYQRKGNFKGFLFVFGLSIIILILAYTQHLVNLLQEKSREYLKFRIQVFEENINNPNTDADFGFFFTAVIQKTDYPIIYTDTTMTPLQCRNIEEHLDTMQVLTPEATLRLKEYLADMDRENPPIPIKYQGLTLGYYHYGVSPVIRQLRWLPFIEITAAVIFILIGYIGFSQIKKSEQRHIWVGMAKETAHQLGTPISSISGWVELLKEHPENVDQVTREIEADIFRLSKVASRFSQIGSVQMLKPTNIVEILENTISYFNKRLPRHDKKISIELNPGAVRSVRLNGDLFEWVIENLIKNAIDAIENNAGKITIDLIFSDDQRHIYIDISDTGKGIGGRDKKNIFKPGFSTKKRGWGLGLSLAKRIIEDYHGGKLFVKESHPGAGSTFRVILPNG
jgi:anti-sigma regulatory factor (Ser/Thr protein kinase)